MASEIKVDTVSEKTSGSGVTIDGLLIKDGGISGDVSLIGTTPTFTIGDAGAEDAALVFDGNAQDFYIALDDSADDLIIGLGATVGTTPMLSFTEAKAAAFTGAVTMASTLGVTGVVTGAGFTAGSAVLAEAELELLDGLTAGTAIASKVVTTDSSIDTSGQRNLTISGELDAATLDISGAIDIAGASQFSSTITVGVDDTGYDVKFFGATASSHMLWDESANTLNLVASTLGVGAVGTKDLGTGIHIKTSDNGGGSVNAAADELIIESNGETGMTIASGSSSGGTIAFGDQANNIIGKISYEHGNNSFQFYTAAEEHVRFQGSTQSIDLNYGGTSVTGNVAVNITGQASASIMNMYHKDAAGGTAIGFLDGSNQACGSISIDGNNNATAYNTSSDYRLKENVNYDFDATTELKKLKPAKFSWKSNSDSTVVEGFLAHEVSEIVPQAIQGTKDATETKQKVVLGKSGNFWKHNVEQSEWEELKNKTGQSDEMANSTWYAEKEIPIYQSIDQSKLVPLMVKTILELEARIKTLEDA